MNVVFFIAVVCLTVGTGFGSLLTPLFRYLRRWGKAAIITVNRATHEVDLIYRKPTNEDYVRLLGSDVPLDGDRRYHMGNRPAFIVDTILGLPLKVVNEGLVALTGQRLREIRKGIKQKIIAAANSADIAALAKYALIGICILGVLLLAGIVMIFKVMKSTGAA